MRPTPVSRFITSRSPLMTFLPWVSTTSPPIRMMPFVTSYSAQAARAVLSRLTITTPPVAFMKRMRPGPCSPESP